MPTSEILAWAMALVVRVVLNTILRIFSGEMPSVMAVQSGQYGLKQRFCVGPNLDCPDNSLIAEKNHIGIGTAYIQSDYHFIFLIAFITLAAREGSV